MKSSIVFNRIILSVLIIFVAHSCKKEVPNSAPAIQSITCTPNTSSSNRMVAGSQATITAVATDSDQDNLSYSWTTDGGNIIGPSDQSAITWQSPVCDTVMTYSITVIVNDGEEKRYKSVNIYVDKEAVGIIKGYVYFAGSKIPVSDVIVDIAGRSSTSNQDGYYEMNNAPQGNQIITATKEGFDTYSTEIQINSGSNQFNIEMTSTIYTHNLSGTITNQFNDPIPDFFVVVLNPNGIQSNLSATSNSSGYYLIPNVPQGQRKVQFFKEPYDPSELEIYISNSDYLLDKMIFEEGLPCPGVPTVSYEGQVYTTIQIGFQCWFKQNLNVGIMGVSSDNGVIEKQCYNHYTDKCDTYGGLYDWNEMMQYTTQQGAQGICPDGWHIPSDQEWSILTDFLGGAYVAGRKLKEAGYSHWELGVGATNSSGFTALPGGYGNDYSFLGIEQWGFWWSSTINYSNGCAYYREMSYQYDGVTKFNENIERYLSVRCLKN